MEDAATQLSNEESTCIPILFDLGRTKDERQKIIQDTVAKIEEKRKKKVALAMHDDQKLMYDEFCATKKETSEICSNEELKNFLATPLDLSNFKGRGFTDLYS